MTPNRISNALATIYANIIPEAAFNNKHLNKRNIIILLKRSLGKDVK